MERIRTIARRAAYSLGLTRFWYEFRDWRRGGAVPRRENEGGVPLPPPALINLVVGDIDEAQFLRTGDAHLRAIAAAVDRNGGDFRNAERILDFGCGCGRLIRHAPKLTSAALYGADYNRVLSKWCSENLSGEFQTNDLRPPLGFPDRYFDVVYLVSIFTHLRLATQNEWLAELRRVVKPGGLVLITFHDEDHPGLAETGATPESLVAQGFLVHNDAAEGSNFIGAFQSREFVRGQFSAQFEVAEIASSGETGMAQALAVLRRPAE